jgi:hypothetical protein
MCHFPEVVEMRRVCSVELNSEVDLRKGEEASIDFLSPLDARQKFFELLEDIELEKTKLDVHVGGLGSWETKAFATKKKGEKTVLFFVLRVADTFKKFRASADVRMGDKICVTLDLIE